MPAEWTCAIAAVGSTSVFPPSETKTRSGDAPGRCRGPSSSVTACGQRVREVRPTAHESIAGGELEQLGVNRAFGEPAVSRQRRDKGRIPAEHDRSDTILRQIEVVDERVARILRRRQAMSVQHRRRAVDHQKHIEGDAPAGARWPDGRRPLHSRGGGLQLGRGDGAGGNHGVPSEVRTDVRQGGGPGRGRRHVARAGVDARNGEMNDNAWHWIAVWIQRCGDERLRVPGQVGVRGCARQRQVALGVPGREARGEGRRHGPVDVPILVPPGNAGHVRHGAGRAAEWCRRRDGRGASLADVDCCRRSDDRSGNRTTIDRVGDAERTGHVPAVLDRAKVYGEVSPGCPGCRPRLGGGDEEHADREVRGRPFRRGRVVGERVAGRPGRSGDIPRAASRPKNAKRVPGVAIAVGTRREDAAGAGPVNRRVPPRRQQTRVGATRGPYPPCPCRKGREQRTAGPATSSMAP